MSDMVYSQLSPKSTGLQGKAQSKPRREEAKH